MELVEIDFKKFRKEIYPYYCELFPEDERKDLKMLKMYEKKKES